MSCRNYKGGKLGANPSNCAWVVLLMLEKSYMAGALTIAHSLRRLKTKHDIVCMITEDLLSDSKIILAQLLGNSKNPIFNKVIKVPYIVHKTKPFKSQKQVELYKGWIDHSFTKWNCLSLTQYDKVILIDADMLVIANCDDLFELKPPAACFANPWAYPWLNKNGSELYNPYVCPINIPDLNDKNFIHLSELPHGAQIAQSQINIALHTKSFVGWGTMILLEPDITNFNKLVSMIHKNTIFGEKYDSISGSDEIALAAFYKCRWTHIHQRYLAIPWKKNWVSCDIRAYHFHGRKPWDMNINEWPDLADWWKVANALTIKYPDLKKIIYPEISLLPIDVGLTQLRITNDIRTIVKNALISPQIATSIINTWLIELLNLKDENLKDENLKDENLKDENLKEKNWASIYYNYSKFSKNLANTIQNEIIDNFIDAPNDNQLFISNIVDKITTLIDSRLKQPPRTVNSFQSCSDVSLSYGSYFTIQLYPRLRQIIELYGIKDALELSIRYAAILDNDEVCIPRQCADNLYINYNVRNEAFASPLNSRLFSKDGITYFSIFSDDSKFNSSGNIFHLKENLKGNWIINPPRGIISVMAAKYFIQLIEKSAEPELLLFFLLHKSDRESYNLLSKNKFYIVEHQSHLLETQSGDIIHVKKEYIYIVLGKNTCMGIDFNKISDALNL